MLKKDILIIAGARPNFMKISPILQRLSRSESLRGRLVHTGQHHDEQMSGSFFNELGIPEPEIKLKVSSGSITEQTAEIMKSFEPVMKSVMPTAILVVGDVTSTLACALTACRYHVPVVHVEAGLRSGDRKMPEEINRILTDQISDLLFTTERDADENLKREGIASEKIHFAGNVMVDSVEYNLEKAIPHEKTLHGVQYPYPLEYGYCLLTLHRPSNVDNEKALIEIITAIKDISAKIPVVFPVHPRTRQKIEAFLPSGFFRNSRIHLCHPFSYLSMMGIMKNSKLVLTDSGGLQEETTALGVPCFTLRDNTERWITVEKGTNTMVGTSADSIQKNFADFLGGKIKKGTRPELWDGKASERIVSVLENVYAGV
jgi:UDP-N-acetylglucosamine 2-epimerase (non-hydrolysing)